MRLTIFGAGSRGDIQPCVMVGRGLQRAGHGVRLAVPENFSAFVQLHGLDVHPLCGDAQSIVTGETGQKFIAAGNANPLQSIRAVREMLGPVATQMAQGALEACHDADALISLAIFAPFATSIAEVRDIPLILFEPTPLFPTGAFPAPGWPVQRNLGKLHNRFSGLAMLELFWQWYRPFVADFRRRLGLRPLSSGCFRQILSTTPLLGAYSPSVIPHPPDWPSNVHVTGYWFSDAATAWQPPPGLEAFLDTGSPPVCIGFGSMVGRDAEGTATLVIEALAQSGQRGVLLTGWGGLVARGVPDNVFVMETAPHDWLFPRMAAVVHHGGAGTTAEGLRAGVPSVIVPFSLDQPFWGKRIQSLGVGPVPVPSQKLTADHLARAIQAAVQDPGIKQRAASLGAAIRAEEGMGNAIQTIEQYLGRGR